MRRSTPRAALVLLLALTTSACRKEAPVPAQPEPTRAAPAASSAAGMETPPPAAPTAVSTSEPFSGDDEPDEPALSPEQRAERAAKHKAAFARARGAVKSKNYKAAVEAFDEAHALLPNDAQTMGERGYAKLLAGDELAAEIDLSAATTLKGDPKTLGQIWYSLGLAYEKRGQAELARMAFAASVSLSSSKAAEGKLQGKSKCAASMIATGHSDAPVVKGWLGVWDALHKPDAAAPRPKTEAAAKDAVCMERPSADPDENIDHCEGSPPWRVAHSVGKYDVPDVTLVFPAEKGHLFMLEIGGLLGGGCSASTDLEPELLPKLVRAKYTYRNKYRITWAPPWGGDPSMECVDSGTHLIDVFYDRATGKRLVAVERTNDLTPPIEVKLLPDESAVTVTGGGCNEKLPLTRPAAPK